jgi:hypothetical protein
MQRPPIIVDANNQLYLWHFDTRVSISSNASPFYPPELRYLSSFWQNGSATIRGESLVTPAYDVYQYGQLLWMLAAAGLWRQRLRWCSKRTSTGRLHYTEGFGLVRTHCLVFQAKFHNGFKTWWIHAALSFKTARPVGTLWNIFQLGTWSRKVMRHAS